MHGFLVVHWILVSAWVPGGPLDSSSTKPVKGGGAGFCTMGVNHFFCTKLVKNVFCTKLVNDDEIFFGTMGVNGIVFLHDGVLKK